MQFYNVYQSGKRLYIDEKEIPDNKIVVNKYDNMQQTLRLISDGTLPPRLYWALRNPKLSNKYFILKLVNNEDLIIGTDISATPGLWDMLLIGTDEDYIIEGTDIDQSRLTYISDHFGRLFVRDNFLEELDFEEQCSPTFRVFYDEIIFRLDNIPDLSDIPDKLSDLENDTNFISGVALKDDGEGNVKIVGTTFEGSETEEGGGGNYNLPVANETTLGGVKPLNKTEDMTLDVGVDKNGRLFAKGKDITVDSELDKESQNPVQNKVITAEVKALREENEALEQKNSKLEEKNAELESSIEKLQIKSTTDKSAFHHITDSANMKVLDIGMEGITEQYTGTITDDEGNEVTVPNPTHPQDIKLAGVLNEETGRYEHKCCVGNKNIWNPQSKYTQGTYRCWKVKDKTKTMTIKLIDKDTTVDISGIYFGSNKNGYNQMDGLYWLINNGDVLKKNYSTTDWNYIAMYAPTLGYTTALKRLFARFDVMVEYGTQFTSYVEAQSQPFTLTSDRPLTKWDYKAKRDGLHGWSIWSGEYVLDSTKNYNVSEWGDLVKFAVYGVPTISNRNEAVCEQFRFVSNPQTLSPQQEAIDWTGTTLQVWLHKDRGILDAESFKAYLEENPIKIRYHASEEQAFIPLPSEEQTLLNNLETYYGVTNVYNEQGCPITLSYISDPELHWNQKLEQINNALLSLGANV